MTNDPEIDPQKSEHQENASTTEHQDGPPKQFPGAELKIPQTIIDEYRTNQHEQQRKDRKTFGVAVATLIVIFFYTTIAGYQGFKMRQATEAAKESANAATKAAKAAEDTFTLNKDSLLAEVQKQTKAMQDSADSMKETVKQGNNALNDTIKNFRLEQRAWVGPIQAISAPYIEGEKKSYVKEGKPVKCGVIIINSGKTPARKLRSVVSLLTLKAGEELTPKFEIDNTTLPHSNVVMQPGTQLLLLPSLNSLHVKFPRILIEATDVSMVGTADVSVSMSL